MKKPATILLALGFTTLLAPAQLVPGLISYQGKVVDNTGTGLGTGTPINRKMLFRLFDAGTGGNRIWSEEQTVTLANGDFSVILGQGVAASYNGSPETPRPSLLTVFGGTDRYLEIVVDNGDGTLNNTDTPITPRQRLIATAFAVRAASADAVTAGSDLSLKDANHGLGWYGTGRLFNGINLDGPALYGLSGGVLGTVNGSTQNAALRWDNTGSVSIGGGAAPTEKLDVNGNAKLSGNLTVGGGVAPPTVNSGGAGMRLRLYPGNNVDTPFGFGIDASTLFSVAPASASHKWYGGTTERMSLNGANGNLIVSGTATAGNLSTAGTVSAGTVSAGSVSAGSLTSTGSVSAASLSSTGGLSFGGFGANPTEGGTTGDFISFDTPGFSEDFFGYSQNTFYLKDSPGGGDSTQPSLVVGGGITTGNSVTISGGVAVPEVGSGGTGMRLSLFAGSPTTPPYGFGIAPGTLFSVAPEGSAFRWYGGTTERMALDSTNGNLTATGTVSAKGKPATTGDEELRIIRGTVAVNGTVLQGSGFTVTGSGGNWTVTFSTAFSGVPSVTANPNGSGGGVGTKDICAIQSTSASSVNIRMFNASNGEQTGWPFSFIAVGPR